MIDKKKFTQFLLDIQRYSKSDKEDAKDKKKGHLNARVIHCAKLEAIAQEMIYMARVNHATSMFTPGGVTKIQAIKYLRNRKNLDTELDGPDLQFALRKHPRWMQCGNAMKPTRPTFKGNLKISMKPGWKIRDQNEWRDSITIFPDSLPEDSEATWSFEESEEASPWFAVLDVRPEVLEVVSTGIMGRSNLALILGDLAQEPLLAGDSADMVNNDGSFLMHNFSFSHDSETETIEHVAINANDPEIRNTQTIPKPINSWSIAEFNANQFSGIVFNKSLERISIMDDIISVMEQNT